MEPELQSVLSFGLNAEGGWNLSYSYRSVVTLHIIIRFLSWRVSLTESCYFSLRGGSSFFPKSHMVKALLKRLSS